MGGEGRGMEGGREGLPCCRLGTASNVGLCGRRGRECSTMLPCRRRSYRRRRQKSSHFAIVRSLLRWRCLSAMYEVLLDRWGQVPRELDFLDGRS